MSSIIPDGQPFNEIDVTLSYSSSISLTTTDDSSVALKEGNVKIYAFCRYTRITLTAGQGCTLTASSDASYQDKKMTYEFSMAGNNSFQLDVLNTNRSKSAHSGKKDLSATINGHSFKIQLRTPAYQQVNVVYDSSFSYSEDSDIDTSACPPAITFNRKGATYFTLSGPDPNLKFADPPFVWYETGSEEKGEDSCIVDQGVDDRNAILTNLHEESDGSRHSFYLQVVDSQGTHKSPDPTIVNVEPPPPSGG